VVAVAVPVARVAPCRVELGEEVAPDGYGGRNSMWGDVVAWYTTEMDDYDIRAYDFSASQFTEITDDNEIQLHPRIHGDRVVYMDLQFGDSGGMGNWNHSAVFMYEISTGVTTQITSGAWIAAYPDVYDNIIVWADYRDSANPNNKNSLSGVEIWGYNIDTTTEFKITNLPGRAKTTPRIWGDKVFVAMYKATSGDAIYMFDLP
jgi:beta propeller repeat protein